MHHAFAMHINDNADANAKHAAHGDGNVPNNDAAQNAATNPADNAHIEVIST